MTTSAEGREAIKEDEGVRYEAYQDTGGVWTIGVGHTRKVYAGQKATPAQVDAWLQEDLAEAEQALAAYVHVPLNQSMYDALAGFVFNIGAGQFRSSTMLSLLNRGLYKDAANEFPKWKFDNGKEIKGLVARRERQRKLFLKPV